MSFCSPHENPFWRSSQGLSIYIKWEIIWHTGPCGFHTLCSQLSTPETDAMHWRIPGGHLKSLELHGMRKNEWVSEWTNKGSSLFRSSREGLVEKMMLCDAVEAKLDSTLALRRGLSRVRVRVSFLGDVASWEAGIFGSLSNHPPRPSMQTTKEVNPHSCIVPRVSHCATCMHFSN